MMKIIKGVCGLLTTMMLLVSCIDTDDVTLTLNNDTAITSFSLGTLNRYMHTTIYTDTAEVDSTYKVTLTGSNYKFSIDESVRPHRIFNADSLPVGTDTKHVLCTITTLNNGLVLFRKLPTDSIVAEADTLSYYSSTDSIDFSVPRTLYVYSTDGYGREEYNVQVNVHQEEGEQFVWIRHANNTDIAALEAAKAVSLNNELYVYGLKAGKTVGYKTADGENWTTLTEIDDEMAYRNMVVGDSLRAIYTIANGSLQRTADGDTWSVVKSNVEVTQLVAANSTELYGLTDDGNLQFIKDGDEEWQDDKFDDDYALFPQEEIAYTCIPANMTKDAEQIILAGISPADSVIASVWRKITDAQSQQDKWVYMERSDNNQFALPQLKNPVMMPYDDGILAWGIVDGEFSPVYQSRDNGLIWKTNTRYQLPEEFNGSTNCFAATTDGKEIWLVSGESGEVWHGHLNKIVWEK